MANPHPTRRRPGPKVPLTPGQVVFRKGYDIAHKRVIRARGRAATHLCVDCDMPAEQWSYNNSGVDEVAQPDSKRVPPPRYSTDIDQYEPRCALCHYRVDKAFRRAHKPPKPVKPPKIKAQKVRKRRRRSRSPRAVRPKKTRPKIVFDFAAMAAALPERPPLPRTNVDPAVRAAWLAKQARLSVEPDPHPLG